MKILAVIFSFSSFVALACGPLTVVDARVKFFPVPIFDSDLKVTAKTGKIKGKFWISNLGKLDKFEIIEIKPAELPRETIEKSIRESRFAVAEGNSVDGVEIEIIFEIKKKEAIELLVPKIAPVKIELKKI